MDHYEILGLQKTASTLEIRKAYAQIARDRHPDRFADPVEKERAQEYFKDATNAFNTLSNERQRKEYDALIARGPEPRTPEELAQAAFVQGQELLRGGAVAGAVDLLRQAVYHQAQNPQYRMALAQALVRDPKSAREGIQILEEAAHADPTNTTVLFDLAVALKSQGLTLRARKAAEAALAQAPQHPVIGAFVAELRGASPEPPKEGGLGGLFRRKT